MIAGLLALLALLAPAAPARTSVGPPLARLVARAVLAHPDSLSETLVEVRGKEARVTMRLQVLSLLEVIPDLDADRDGEVSTDEVTARRDAIMGYVLEHYGFWTDADRELQGGVPLLPQPMTLWHTPRRESDGYRKGSVGLELLLVHDAPIRDLMVESSLFLLTSPAHMDLLTITWDEVGADGAVPRDGGRTSTFTLSGREPRARFDPEGRGAFTTFVGLGFHHILSGWDHLAFVGALVLASRRLRSLLGVVTAFTVAHSITLALAALGVVETWAYSGFIEACIALSIAYVATDCLVHPRATRARWAEAGIFGLVHGLGFAGFLANSLVREPARLTALFAFNVGVEIGQVLVVLGLVGVLALVPRGRREAVPTDAAAPGARADERFLAPALVRRLGSAAIAVLGFVWFAQRL